MPTVRYSDSGSRGAIHHSNVQDGVFMNFTGGGGVKYLLACSAHTKEVAKPSVPIFSYGENTFFAKGRAMAQFPLNTPLVSKDFVFLICEKNK